MATRIIRSSFRTPSTGRDGLLGNQGKQASKVVQ